MEKYIVNVLINKHDEEGKIKSENFDYEFETTPLNFIEARRKAIAKAKDLKLFLENELPENEFLSFEDAQMKDIKDFNSYTISIFFETKDGDSTQIYYLDREEILDWLESEYKYYKSTYNIVRSLKVEYNNNEYVVIEEDFGFLSS